MPIAIIALTLLCVVGIAVGQILFKKAAMHLPESPQFIDWLMNSWLIIALILYAITTLLWIWVLRNAPLHIAYPFMALAFIIVPLLSYFFLGEPINTKTFIGGAIIAIGVTITATH
jgi:drug/metabolite transporter (DMT)-like permease